MNKYLFAIAVFLLWLFLIASPASAGWEFVSTFHAPGCFHQGSPRSTVTHEPQGNGRFRLTIERAVACGVKTSFRATYRCEETGIVTSRTLIMDKWETGTKFKNYDLCLEAPESCECTCSPNSDSNGDRDNDGVPDCVDDDIDGDGDRNEVDPDVDGDGVNNNLDCDIDGDGKKNNADPDMDADGKPNAEDDDVDGDQIANDQDDDPVSDIDLENVPPPSGRDCGCLGVNNNFDDDIFINEEDGNIDGDEHHNCNDPDVDGDGVPNEDDPDMDGDCIPNDEDITPKGHGCQADSDDDGIPNACDPDSVLCADEEDKDGDGEPDGNGVCDREECSKYNDDDDDGIPNFCDAKFDGEILPPEFVPNPCQDENDDGVCDDSECSEWKRPS